MLTAINLILPLLSSLLAQEPTPAPDASSVPEYTCAHISGRPYTVEETVLVEVRVVAPPGPPGAGAGRARVEIHHLDLGTHYAIPALGFDRANVDVNSSIRVRVPLGRRLGVSAYSPERGYDEVVLEPIARTAAEENAGVRVVSLALPEPTEAGSVSFVRQWVEGARRGDSRVGLSLRLPLTGARVAESGSGREGAVHLKASVPPGEYLLCAEPFEWRFCGESPIQCPDTAGFAEAIQVHGGEETEVQRPFEFGVQIKALFHVHGADKAQLPAFDRDYEYLFEGDWWYGGAKRSEAGRWYVHATAARFDPATGRYGYPLPMRWMADSHHREMEWTIAPVEHWMASSCAYAPGQYRVHVTGALVQDAAFDLVIEDKRRRGPVVEWTLLRQKDTK